VGERHDANPHQALARREAICDPQEDAEVADQTQGPEQFQRLFRFVFNLHVPLRVNHMRFIGDVQLVLNQVRDAHFERDPEQGE